MDDTLNNVIGIFAEKFAPTDDIANATDYLDTLEVHSAILKLIPECSITAQQVFEALEQKGYLFNAEPGKMNFNLKWMLIRMY
jgi:hypothetical protein